MKVYECWPNDNCHDKGELYDWCEKMFGPGNVDNGWSVTSHYADRPIKFDKKGELINPCPYLFRTTDPKKLTFFKLRWA